MSPPSVKDLRHRAKQGDPHALAELYRLEAREGSRTHREVLAFAEQIRLKDPLLDEREAFDQAVERYHAVHQKDWSMIAGPLQAAQSLRDLQSKASKLDLTIKIHWRGISNLDRSHMIICDCYPHGPHDPVPVSALIINIIE